MATIWQDVRYAARTVVSMRGGAALAVLILAIGIGATTTMFSVVYAALLRPLPFAEPDRIVMLYLTRTSARARDDRMRFSHPELAALAAQATSFESVASFSRTNLAIALTEPEQIDGEVISARYFDLLRVVPIVGRGFTVEEDTQPGAHPLVVISARMWRGRMAGDPNVLSRMLPVNGVPLRIIGVMPDGFNGLSGRADLWIPTAMAARLTYAEYLTTPQHFMPAVARLKPGVTLDQANAEMAAIGPRAVAVDTQEPDATAVWGGRVLPVGEARIDPAVERSALLLFAGIACVLLIACANVASLLMARLRQRRREIAVRNALGAGAWRVMRQFLTESVLLATVGGLAGTLLAVWGVHFVALTAPSALPSSGTGYVQVQGFAVPALDGVALFFALGATLVTSLIFGVAPAVEAGRTDLLSVLREDQRTTASGRSRVLSAIVVAEIAIAVLLVTGASLFVTSFAQMQRWRTGFETDDVLAFWITPPASRYRPGEGPAVVERLLTAIQQAPGVALAAVNRCTPFYNSCARTTLHLAGEAAASGPAPAVERHYVSADYFRVLGIPVKRGRAFLDSDRMDRPPVVVINERAAARYWPGEDPIGKRIWFGSAQKFMDPKNPAEIVGVVGDVKYGAVDDPVLPDFYTSYLQFSWPDTMVVVKTNRGGAAAVVPALRQAVASVDAGLPIYGVMTLEDRISETLTRPRFHATMLTIFAGAALLLAAVGVYGVMSYVVSSRIHEIGVRVALGADAGRVMRLVLGDSVKLAAIGGVIGIAAAVALTRLIRNLLVDVAPTDPLIMTFAAIVLVGAAVLAAFVPARRASRVDPIVVLRNQ
ncbi:MAG TPA: ABC transporter permease [Vicinamibacterales bacterium]|nr:ABC transporter permease [Vicinamibacterales bacterium]